MTQGLKLVLGIVENIVGKGENAGNQHFLLFPQCFFSKSFLSRGVKSRDCVVKGNHTMTTFEGYKSFENTVGNGENAGHSRNLSRHLHCIKIGRLQMPPF